MDVSRSNSVGDTVEFWFSEYRDLLAPSVSLGKPWSAMAGPVASSSTAARLSHHFLRSANRLQDCSRRRLKPITIRKSRYLNNRIEQDHRRIKLRVRPMLGFKSPATASITLSGSKCFT
ncbi:DDE-type integrase/transposase/recombinase [Mesorhizobium sp.]|uniref:DDE-type integrase/transposase/recombinase n=1 Tax=Mesorhizobium sp. TaxID=1871066 RepID=UPI000FE58D5C|nr:MAG: DDE domain-containing protein [Mesorhizobium sp.]